MFTRKVSVVLFSIVLIVASVFVTQVLLFAVEYGYKCTPAFTEDFHASGSNPSHYNYNCTTYWTEDSFICIEEGGCDVDANNPYNMCTGYTCEPSFYNRVEGVDRDQNGNQVGDIRISVTSYGTYSDCTVTCR